MMKRIEVRDIANHGEIVADHSTEGVVTIAVRAGYRKVTFGQAQGHDGRTFCVIPSEFTILDVTINAPGDLFMVTVEAKS